MRVRLRPKHTDEMIAELYAKPYDHTLWDEHVSRVQFTIHRLNRFIALQRPQIQVVADLSCGDGALLRGIDGITDANKIYGDLVAAPHLTVQPGDITNKVSDVIGDLLICSETLEHLDDPDEFLRTVWKNFEWIAITTPMGENDPEKNYEHYWGWDVFGINNMLHDAGWSARHLETLNLSFYTYQFWIAKRVK